MVQVIDNGNGWQVIVDGIVRGTFADPFRACREARRWGW